MAWLMRDVQQWRQWYQRDLKATAYRERSGSLYHTCTLREEAS